MQTLKTKSGTRYREKVYIDNEPQYSPRFKRKSDAKTWKARMLVEREQYKATGIIPVKTETKLAPKFNEYAKDWLEKRVKVKNSKSTYQNYESNLRVHLIPLFKAKRLDSFNVNDGHRLIGKLKANGHNTKGINVILGVLKTLFIDAFREEVIDKNPLIHLSNLKKTPRSDVYLTDMEIKCLLQASKDHHLYSTFLLALNTGMRKGELAGLCWDRVNFETNLIEITRTRDKYGLEERLKTTSSRRFVPMNQDVRRHLTWLRKEKLNSKYVLVDFKGEPIRAHHLYRAFKQAQERAGFHRFYRFHDLRHTFASHFMMKGGNIYDLQKILGHSSLEMTQRYAHLAPSHLVNAIGIISFNSENENVLGPKTGPNEMLELVK